MVYLDVADGTLVFDGVHFLPAEVVEKVLLGKMSVTPVVGSSPENVYPVQKITGPYSLGFETQWLCDVLERGLVPPSGITPIPIDSDSGMPDPGFPEGSVCMITCFGTEIQYVQIL